MLRGMGQQPSRIDSVRGDDEIKIMEILPMNDVVLPGRYRHYKGK